MRKIFILFFILYSYVSHSEIVEYSYTVNATLQTSIVGQTFTIGTTGDNKDVFLQSIKVTFNSFPTDVVTFEIFESSAGFPTGSAISTGVIPGDGEASYWRDVAMSSVILHFGVQYFLKITVSGSSGAQFHFNYASLYSGGSFLVYSGSWSAYAGDLGFEISGVTTLNAGSINTDQQICYNTDANAFTSAANASGGTGTLVYTWQYSTTSNVAGVGSWNDIGSSNSATHDPSTLTQPRYYTRRIHDSFDTLYSNVLTITVYAEVLAGTIYGNATICYSDNAPLIVSTAPGSGGYGTITYQWQYSTTSSVAGEGSWVQLMGSNSANYDPGYLLDTTYYVRRVLNACGYPYSNVITMTVRPIFIAGSVGSNQTINSGDDVAAFTSSAPASGGSSSFTYQWQYSTTSNIAGAGVWVDIVGATSSTYNHGTLTQKTWFTRKATDAICGIEYSNVILVNINVVVGDCNPQIYNPLFRYTFDNTDADSSSNGRTLKKYGHSYYNSSTKIIGSHSLDLDGGNDWATIPVVDYGSKILISFWARTDGAISADRMFFCIADASSNFYLLGKATNSVRAYTLTNSTSPFTWTSGEWHHIALYLEKKVSNTAVRMWLDGSRVTLADSLLLLTFNSNDSIRIGADYYGNSDYPGNIDEFLGYRDFTPSNSDIACLYTASYIGNVSAPMAKKRGNKGNRVIRYEYDYNTKPVPPLAPPVDPPDDPVEENNYGYTRHYQLAIRQKFAIPEDVNNGDHVGNWLKTRTWQSVGTISYTLMTHTDRFAVNSSTGLISILDASKIDGKVVQQDTAYNLIIRTTDAGLGYEDDTAVVWVKERAYCHFYNWTGSGNGLSRTTPAHYMPTGGTAKTPGHGYFMERGKTFLNGGMISFNTHLATAEHPTIVGAYGAGAKPRFRDTGNDANVDIGFFLGYNVNSAPWYDTNPDRLAKHIYFYDLHMQNYYSSAFKSSIPNCEYGFYNLDIMNCNRYGNDDAFKFHDLTYLDSAWVMPTELINVKFDTAGITGLGSENKAYIKIGSGPVTITNCWFGPMIDQEPCFAFRLTNGKGSIVRHSYTNAANPYTANLASTALGGIQVRQKDVQFIDNIFEGVNNGIYVITPTGTELNATEDAHVTPARLTFKNNWFKNNLYAGLRFHQSSTPYWPYANMLIEDNLFTPASGASVALVIRDFLNSTIRRNEFHGAAIGLLGSTNEASNYTSVYYNLFLGQTGNAIEFTAGSGLKFYNNTVNGSISLIGVSAPVVTNNLHRSLNGSYTGTSNYDIDGINIYENFVDPIGGNWRLLPTSTLIDQGSTLSPVLTPALNGVTVPQGSFPEPGAYETE